MEAWFLLWEANMPRQLSGKPTQFLSQLFPPRSLASNCARLSPLLKGPGNTRTAKRAKQRDLRASARSSCVVSGFSFWEVLKRLNCLHLSRLLCPPYTFSFGTRTNRQLPWPLEIQDFWSYTVTSRLVSPHTVPADTAVDHDVSACLGGPQERLNSD